MTGIASGVESGSNSGSGKAGRGIPPPPPSAAPSSSSAKYTANTSPELLYRQIIQSCVSLQSIPMLVVTWNVNAHVESIASLRDALFYPREDDVQSPSNNHTNSMSLPHPINPYTTGESSDNSRPMSTSVFSDIGEDRSIIHPKLVVVGLQEMVELSTTSVLSSTVIGQQCQERLTTWETMILDCLHLENSYFELISSHYMVGLALMVFATADIKAMMHHYQISSLPRGVGGVLGNKGALYARFELLDSSICIVNAHFAAHRNAVKKRNADYNAIVSHKAFPDYLHDKLQALTQYTGNEVNLSNYESSHIQQLRSKLHSIDKKIHHLQSDVMQHSLHFHSTNYVEGSPLQGLPLHPSSEVRSSVVDGDGSVGRSSAASTTSLSTSSSLPSSTSSSTQPPNSSSSQPPPPPHHVSHHPQYHPSHSHHHHHKHRHYKKKHTHEGNALSAEDHDIILWLGDLNYRIQDDLDMMTVYEMIDRDEIIPLAMFDQLNQERDIGNAFHNFHEGLLTFPPTYQYIPGTNEYDRRKDKKMRCPAWCDRILWRVGKESIERERTSLIEQDIHSIASSSFILPSSSAGNGDNGSATAGEEKISRAVKALEEDSDTDNEEESTHSDDQKTNTAGNDSDNEVITDFDQIIEDLKVKKTHEINQRMSLRNLRKSLLEEENSKMSLLATVSELNNLQIDESIELMSYHRCSNVISDHKPVKAVLNVKVKSVDWMKFEQDLIKQFQPYLYDVVKSPTVVNPRQSTTYSSSSTMPTNYQDPSFSGWDNLKFPYLKCLPSIATLTSHSLQGDEATILLQNTSNRFTACVQLEATSVPGWIIVDLSDIVIPPHSVRNLVIRNDHQLSTSELSDVVMSYKDFDDENLPTLSRALQLPSNETKLEITGMLKAKIQWMLSNVGEDSSNSRGSQKYGFYNHLLKGSFYDNNRDSQSSNSTSSVGNGNSSNRVSSSGTEDDRPGSTSSTKSQEPPRNNIISTEQLIIPVLCSHAYNEKIANGATI